VRPALCGAEFDLGVDALRVSLQGRRIVSVEVLADGGGWVRVTFDDKTSLDLPGACLSEPTAPVDVPAPRRST
jgi:hypothetical protein